MAVSLVGEVANSCDSTTGWNQGNISGDDDFVEGSGAIGLKCSASTCDMYTTSLGASAPYDFSGTGSEDGDHIIMRHNTKTPINATSGMAILVGDGTNQAVWNVVPRVFYKGGFVTVAVDTARDFDTIISGSWTTTGNPGQLTSISELGARFVTTTSIMGNFNNVQIDQMTVGTGLRVDAGTSGSPNTFETVRSADEDTNFWGWWGSTQGAIISKGKLFIGPASGTNTSVFDDTAFSIAFADERVGVGFYEINTRGGGTDVTWDLGSISAAEPTNARWSLTVQSDTNSFEDTNGVWFGADQLTLNSPVTLTGTTMANCTKLTQNGATLSGVSVLDANTADGVAFIESDDPSLISGSEFAFSDGHAIEITATGTYTFSGNTFSGYGADDTNDAAIYNNSGGSVTLNITNAGDTPTVRNGSGASTTINNAVTHTVTGLASGSQVIWIRVSDDVELENKAESGGEASYSYNYVSDTDVDVQILSLNEKNKITRVTLGSSDATLPASQNTDPFYNNP